MMFLRLPATMINLIKLLNNRRTTRMFTRVDNRPFLIIRAIMLRFRERYLRKITLNFHGVSHFPRLIRRRVTPSTKAFVMTRQVVREQVLTRTRRHDHFLGLRVFQFTARMNGNDDLSTCHVIRRVRLIRVRNRSFLFYVMALRLCNGRPFSKLLRRAFRRVINAKEVGLFKGLLNSNATATNVLLRRSATLRCNAHRNMNIGTQVFNGACVFHDCRNISSVKQRVVMSRGRTIFLAVKVDARCFSILKGSFYNGFMVQVFRIFRQERVTCPTLNCKGRCGSARRQGRYSRGP